MWPRRNPLQGTETWFSIVLYAFALLSQPVDAGIFGVIIPTLGYDVVSVQESPVQIGDLTVVMEGSALSVGIIQKTANIPSAGLSGILYDMGYACQSEFDPSTTLPTPNLYGLPKVALIQRGGPGNTTCTFRDKMLVALGDGAIAAIIYNSIGQGTIDGATAETGPSDSVIPIPGLVVSHESGVKLKSLLPQTNITNATDPSSYNRVRVSMGLNQQMPIVWEFVLIVVVVLLGVSFLVSVVLHCRLYSLRQRYRAEAIARGGDILPNGTIRIKNTLEKAALDEFPIRIFGQSGTITPTTLNTGAGPSRASMSLSVSTLTEQLEKVDKEVNSKNDDTTVDLPGYTGDINTIDNSDTLPKGLSRKNSISGQSVRSATAIVAAEALYAGAAPGALPQHEIINDTCAICIEDFSDGEEIRKLPCHHEFHYECIDPWLTQKSSTCPLCKYECMRPSIEPVQENGETPASESQGIPRPRDRLMEFIMGSEWVAARKQGQHNGTSWVDRVGYFFGKTWDRICGRPPRPPPGPTASPLQSGSAPLPMPPQMDESGDMPMQSITSSGFGAMPANRQTQGRHNTLPVVVSIEPMYEYPLPPLPRPVL